ncbi:hypothetical protein K2173_022327 [Erythroxylum novogranatense]|uniref:Uncharacterized protein n=1 Tax=Erythroxylum novogranatense TaxID=1862640 RepID=A0AAV8TJ69_9ROSI|nr:hypothetical protein K2173_022327 [Erythroxylum novogranatense]
MASSSPAPSNNGSDAVSRFAPPKTLRGLNKPKCIQCGNVARSRCPYQSCKSCCSKAQNPCHIHVLKANATFPDKTPDSASPLFDQKSSEVSPSVNAHRVASLRQLSNSFSQFSNVHSPLRSRKPLTRKEAVAINEWRFSKLKEYRDGNIAVENESFDRYMQNVSLLEEVFSHRSITDCSTEDKSLSSSCDHSPAEPDAEKMRLELKLKLRSNPVRTENIRKRIQQIVDEGLKKLRQCDANSDANDQKKRKVGFSEKLSALSELTDKLHKVQNMEDLKSCLEMKARLYDQSTQVEIKDSEGSEEQTTQDGLASKKGLDFGLQKSCKAVETNQEDLDRINEHFCILEKIEDL